MQSELEKRINAAVRRFIGGLLEVPGYADWQNEKLGRVLDPTLADIDFDSFDFPELIERRRQLIVAFMELHSAALALVDLQYYFKVYPFTALPVSRGDHLRYTCEAFFSRIYQFRELIKRFGNMLNNLEAAARFDVGKLLKQFDSDFDQELRARNRIHHHERFEDIAIDRVSIPALLSGDADLGVSPVWDKASRAAYRRAAREWAERVVRRAKRLELYRLAIGEFMLEHVEWFVEGSQIADEGT